MRTDLIGGSSIPGVPPLVLGDVLNCPVGGDVDSMRTDLVGGSSIPGVPPLVLGDVLNWGGVLIRLRVCVLARHDEYRVRWAASPTCPTPPRGWAPNVLWTSHRGVEEG